MDTVGQEPSYLVRLFVLHYDDVYEIKEGLEEPIDCKLISFTLHIFLYSVYKFCSCLLSY